MSEAGEKKKRRESRNMTKVVRIRLTPEDYEFACACANTDHDGSVSAYFRALNTQRMGKRDRRSRFKLPPDIAGSLIQLRNHLGYLNNNANQIARHLNMGGFPNAEDFSDAAKHIIQMRVMVNAALGVVDEAVKDGRYQIVVDRSSPLSLKAGRPKRTKRES